MFRDLLDHLITLSGCQKKAIANALGYDPSLLSKWLNGSTLPTHDKATIIMMRLAQFFVQEVRDPARRLEMVGEAGQGLSALSDDQFNRMLYDQLSRTYWSQVNGEPTEVAEDKAIFEANTFISSNFENIFTHISEHLSNALSHDPNSAISISTSGFDKISWQEIFDHLKKIFPDNGVPFSIDLKYFPLPRKTTYSELSDFFDFACRVKRISPRMTARITFSTLPSPQSFIWIHGYGAILALPVNSHELYVFVEEQLMPPDALLNANDTPLWHTVESHPTLSLQNEATELMKSNYLTLLNLPLAPLVLSQIPDWSPWTLPPSPNILMLQSFTTALRAILKDKSYFVRLNQEEVDHFVKTGELHACDIKITLSTAQIRQAFESLKNANKNNLEQIFYLQHAFSPHKTNQALTLMGENELHFYCFHSEGQSMQNKLRISDPQHNAMLYKKISAELDGQRRLGLTPREFWTLVENMFKGEHDE